MIRQARRLLHKFLYCSFSGDAGIIWIASIMALTIFLGGFMVGGVPKLRPIPNDAQLYEVVEEKNSPKSNTKSVQLRIVKSKKVDRKKVPDPKKNKNDSKDSAKSTTPGATSAPTATTTPAPQACSNIAVDFLVDESSSMLSSGKLTQVKFVLKEYVRTLPDKALFAMHSFAEPPQAAKEEQSFVEVGTARDNIITKIDTSLNPPSNPEWATYMREGFKLAQSRLSTQKRAKPDYKYHLILISDGVPEVDICDNGNPRGGSCNYGEGQRNYDLGQDPTYTGLGQPNIPAQIKQSGVTIYSVGIFTDDDEQINSQLQTLLRNVASSPSNFYKADSTSQLTNIFSQLSGNICK